MGKRFVSILAVLFCVSGLVSCPDNGDGGEKKETKGETDTVLVPSFLRGTEWRNKDGLGIIFKRGDQFDFIMKDAYTRDIYPVYAGYDQHAKVIKKEIRLNITTLYFYFHWRSDEFNASLDPEKCFITIEDENVIFVNFSNVLHLYSDWEKEDAWGGYRPY